MSTNSEPDLNIILRKSLNKSSGNIQMIVMLLVTIIVKMMVVMKIMIMKVSIVSNYIYFLSFCSVQKYWIGYPEAFCTEVPNLSSGISYLTFINRLILMTINKKKMVMMTMIMKVSIGWATILPQPPRSNPRGEWRYHRDLSKNDDDCDDYDNWLW